MVTLSAAEAVILDGPLPQQAPEIQAGTDDRQKWAVLCASLLRACVNLTVGCSCASLVLCWSPGTNITTTLQDSDRKQDAMRKVRSQVEGMTKDMLVSANIDNSSQHDNPYKMQGGRLKNIQEVVGRTYIVFTAPAGGDFMDINDITPITINADARLDDSIITDHMQQYVLRFLAFRDHVS
jgi:hypothetical protein